MTTYPSIHVRSWVVKLCSFRITRYAHAVTTPHREPRDANAEWRSWEKRFARQVLSTARRVRKERKFSAREVSERLTDAGWPVTVNSVNGILGAKGRESISVPQLIALATALEVSPAELLFDPFEREVEIEPGVAMTPGRAVAWFFRGVAVASPPLGEPTDDPEELDKQLRAHLSAMSASALRKGGFEFAVGFLAGASAGVEKLARDLGIELGNGSPADAAE